MLPSLSATSSCLSWSRRWASCTCDTWATRATCGSGYSHMFGTLRWRFQKAGSLQLLALTCSSKGRAYVSWWCPAAQEINPSPEGYGKTVTVGEFVRDVFLEQVSPMQRPHVFCAAVWLHMSALPRSLRPLSRMCWQCYAGVAHHPHACIASPGTIEGLPCGDGCAIWTSYPCLLGLHVVHWFSKLCYVLDLHTEAMWGSFVRRSTTSRPSSRESQSPSTTTLCPS